MPNQSIERVTCERCGRTPTDASNHTLQHGYCLVCWDRREVKALKANLWALALLKALHTGTWRTPEERDTDDAGTVQATVDDLQ